MKQMQNSVNGLGTSLKKFYESIIVKAAHSVIAGIKLRLRQ